MRGADTFTESLFTMRRLEDFVPAKHPLRAIREMANTALAQLARTEEAAKAAEVLLGSYPGLTVERHLRNFRWKTPADIAHYRDGLLKAGVPLRTLTLVGSGPKFTANS